MISGKFFVKILLIIGVVGGLILFAIIGALKIVILIANPLALILYFLIACVVAIFLSLIIANYIMASVRKNIKSVTKHETTGL